MPALDRLPLRHFAERGKEPEPDLADRGITVNGSKQTTFGVVGRERRGLLLVELLTTPDHLDGVVGATLDTGPFEEPPEEDLAVHDELDDGIECVAGPA